MNIQQLRQSLKMKWLGYYAQNRPWLVKMRIWGTYDGVRRPCSGFMLATLSVLEPQFEQILSFLTELSNNPDKIIAALGLNFSPEEELDSLIQDEFIAANEFLRESLEEIQDRVQHVSLVTDDSEVTSESPTRILNSEQPLADLASTNINLPSLTETDEKLHPHFDKLSASQEDGVFGHGEWGIGHGEEITVGSHKPQATGGTTSSTDGSEFAVAFNELVCDRQPVTSVAVATQGSRESSAKTLLIDKPPAETIVQNQPERSLAITTEIPSRSTTMLPSAMPTEIPQNYTNLKSLAVAIKIPSNSKSLKMQLPVIPTKTKLLSSTNARSLASWVDEFCQGADWNPEESNCNHF